MTEMIFSDVTASISELKANPMKIVNSAEGETVAILNRNKPAFYCVPPEIYEAMVDCFDDMELHKIIQERKGSKEIEVDINDL